MLFPIYYDDVLDHSQLIRNWEKTNVDNESRKVRTPCLFMHDNLGQVLQR